VEIRLPGKSGKKTRFFHNYMSTMVLLCEEYSADDQVGVWIKMYAFMVFSGVLFPRTPYGAAWNVLQYVEEIDTSGEYAWAEAMWRMVVETIEDTQRKLFEGPISEVQLNGFSVHIQVILQCAMLYKIFESYGMKCEMNYKKRILQNEFECAKCDECEVSRADVRK